MSREEETREDSCDGCPGYCLMSLDSLPPYVYCTGCKKPCRCKTCGAPTGGNCYPHHTDKRHAS